MQLSPSISVKHSNIQLHNLQEKINKYSITFYKKQTFWERNADGERKGESKRERRKDYWINELFLRKWVREEAGFEGKGPEEYKCCNYEAWDSCKQE